jgi:hypothetical protein
MALPPCQFTMVGGQVTLAKKGDTTHWSMDPPNAHPCTVGAKADGDLEVIQVGSDGGVTVRATSDNARGTVYVTKTCTEQCGPTTVTIAIGNPAPSWTIKQKLSIVYLIISMALGIGGLVAGAILGGFWGVLIGWFGGIGLGMVIAWVIEKILDP